MANWQMSDPLSTLSHEKDQKSTDIFEEIAMDCVFRKFGVLGSVLSIVTGSRSNQGSEVALFSGCFSH
jgi:hypothetical protein